MRHMQAQTLLWERGGYFREVVVWALGIESDPFPHSEGHEYEVGIHLIPDKGKGEIFVDNDQFNLA